MASQVVNTLIQRLLEENDRDPEKTSQALYRYVTSEMPNTYRDSESLLGVIRGAVQEFIASGPAVIRRLLLILTVGALLMASSPAWAALNCDVQITNNPGDTITGRYNIQFGDGSIGFQVATDAGETGIWNPPSQSANPERPYFEIGFNAAVANEHIVSRQTSGSSGGWSCGFSGMTVTRVAPPPPLFSVLSDPDKNTANFYATFLSAVAGVWQGSALGFVLTGDVPLSVLLGAMAYGTDKFANHFHEIARDPWDGDYCSSPSFEIDPQTVSDIGWAQAYETITQGWLVYSIELVNSFAIYAETAANRALSAAQVGAWDCASIRRAEAIWAFHQMENGVLAFEWSVGATANQYLDTYDMSPVYNQLDGLNRAASWLGELQ
jgi:hypothetical protein